MFDPVFYRLTNPDLAKMRDWSLKRHYSNTGWKEGRDPSAFFNVAGYLARNKDVADSGVEPLKHFLKAGRREGRENYLSAWGGPTTDLMHPERLEMCRDWVDPTLIRAAKPEFAALSDDALIAWYVVQGWREGINPSDKFSTKFYIATYRDVEVIDMSPLLHYLRFGRPEGRFATAKEQQDSITGPIAEKIAEKRREAEEKAAADAQDVQDVEIQEADTVEVQDAAAQAKPVVDEAPAAAPEPEAPQEPAPEPQEEPEVPAALLADMDAVRSEFDAKFYRSSYPDMQGDDDALLMHYMLFGWKERRNPSEAFSTAYYLDHYIDIAESGTNPLLHYVLFGRNEGRRCSSGGAIRLGYSETADLTPGFPNTGQSTFKGTKARPPRSSNPNALDIHWVVPDFRAGSGGHMTIFRMVRYLEQFGHRCTVWIEEAVFHDTPLEAWETIVKSFQCVEAEVRFVGDDLHQTSGDVIIATGWSTAWTIKDVKGFKTSMYFVQDHEPEFYPTGAMSNLARQTYDFDFGCICASPWLENLMQTRYGRWAQGFYLAYEPEQYFVDETIDKTQKGNLKIAVYGRAHTDRRCVQLALAGLQILAGKRTDFEVHFFGQDDLPFNEAPFKAYNHGVLSSEALSALYNECDLGICFSGTNYSLVPQEMMACGLPLVEFNTESTQVIFPKSTVTLAGPAPVDIASKLDKLMDSESKRDRQRKAALKWVQKFSWKDSARQVEGAILEYLDHKGAKLSAPAVAKTKDILFDVVVPTWNGKEEFVPVLEALRSQRMADQMQIHCVDSTSSDGTIEWLRDQKDVSLTVIDQKDFQHGRTRNFGASLGKAPFVGFITQDAMPATPHWASDIVKMMRAVPDAAGLFGRHIAYPDHPIFVQEEITTHFENMLKHPLVLSKHTDPERWESGDLGWRQLLHFYSDNNSAMRRDVWNDIPYPEVDYGEDQVWARDIIEAGHSKIYAPTATVFHSHDYNPEQTYKRSKTEGEFFHQYFGYELGKGTEEEIARNVAREQHQMELWGRRRQIDAAEIEMRKANIAEKYRGWRDGRAASEARMV